MRITREGFDTILSKALTGKAEKERGMESKAEVRLQWDPDHHPSGSPEKRRAIQLGLRDKVMIVAGISIEPQSIPVHAFLATCMPTWNMYDYNTGLSNMCRPCVWI